MKKYIIERTVGTLTKEQIMESGKISKDVVDEMPGVTWIRSYYSEREGKVYCEYYAPDIESIIEHARRAGFPIDRISEVSMEFNPFMFT